MKSSLRPAVTKKEFEALSELNRLTPNSVRAQELAQDRSFFVMDWVDAPLLIRPLRAHAPRRQKAITMAGAWLSQLQRSTLRNGLTRNSTLFRIRPPHVYRGPVGPVASRLRGQARALGPLAGPTVALHGDFHHGNLFFQEERLIAFDRLFNKHGNAYFDAAWFLCHLALFRESDLEAAKPWPGDHDGDRRWFFNGYGAIDQDDLASFDLIEDIVLTKMWQARKGLAIRGIDSLIRAFGLLDPDPARERPGRLVKPSGGPPVLTNAAAATLDCLKQSPLRTRRPR